MGRSETPESGPIEIDNIYIYIYTGLNGGVTLVGGSETPESGPIILVDFKIVMFSASGLKVDALTLSGIICIIIYIYYR